MWGILSNVPLVLYTLHWYIQWISLQCTFHSLHFVVVCEIHNLSFVNRSLFLGFFTIFFQTLKIYIQFYFSRFVVDLNLGVRIQKFDFFKKVWTSNFFEVKVVAWIYVQTHRNNFNDRLVRVEHTVFWEHTVLVQIKLLNWTSKFVIIRHQKCSNFVLRREIFILYLFQCKPFNWFSLYKDRVEFNIVNFTTQNTWLLNRKFTIFTIELIGLADC